MIGRETRQGGVAPLFLVDAEFAEEVGRWSWCGDSNGYLCSRTGGGRVSLHRFVWKLRHGDCPPMLDHINGVKWDCRLENLRPATHELNTMNLTQPRPKHSLPRGVSHADNKTNAYKASIRLCGKRKHLGYFPTTTAASEAYEKARSKEIARRAEVARINHQQGGHP